MISESARMSSAAEARFRVQVPNSLPRVINVIALDAAADAVIRRLSSAGWKHAAFFTTNELAAMEVRRIVEEPTPDLVVLVAGPGGHAFQASLIGEACSRNRVMTTGFIVGAQSAPEAELSKTLAQVRPWSLMMVISRTDDYLDDMMSALRA